MITRSTGRNMFAAKCRYRGSRWYAYENLVFRVKGHNLSVSLNACNWDLGIGSSIWASGCDCQFEGQYTVTGRYGGELGPTVIAV